MNVAFKKTKLYVKLVLIIFVVITSAVVLLNNRANQATVWFFKEYKNVNVLKLMLVTAVASIISFWILSTAFKLWKDWREVSLQVAHQQKEKQLEQRAEALNEQERRIGEKVDETSSDPS